MGTRSGCLASAWRAVGEPDIKVATCSLNVLESALRARYGLRSAHGAPFRGRPVSRLRVLCRTDKFANDGDAVGLSGQRVACHRRTGHQKRNLRTKRRGNSALCAIRLPQCARSGISRTSSEQVKDYMSWRSGGRRGPHGVGAPGWRQARASESPLPPPVARRLPATPHSLVFYPVRDVHKQDARNGGAHGTR